MYQFSGKGFLISKKNKHENIQNLDCVGKKKVSNSSMEMM